MTRMDTMAAATRGGRARGAPLWLMALFVLEFASGTNDMVIAGVLPEIATGLGVSVPVSGQLVTAYALTFALSAPVSALLTARMPRRALLTGACAVFVAASLIAAAAPVYPLVLGARIVAALAAGAAAPASVAAAAEAAPEGRRGRYIAVVSAGLTTSLVVGVPVGTWIGGALGWRATMLYVAALAAVAAVGLLTRLPDLPGAPPRPLRERLAPLGRPSVALALLAMVPGGAGGMMCYVYITEIIGRLGDVPAGATAPIITLVGLAGIAGALAGGRAADRYGTGRTLIVFLAGTLAAPLAMAALGALGGPYPVVVVIAVFGVWGFAAWGLGPVAQARLLAATDAPANEVLALNTSAMFLGFSLAGGVGGAALGAGGAGAVPPASAGCLMVSIVLFIIVMAIDRRRGVRA